MTAIDNAFSMVHDTQFVYRLLLNLTARPGETGSIAPAAGKIGLLPGAGDAALALAFTLLDSEVGCFVDLERLPGLADAIRLRTLSRRTDAASADYLFADGTAAPGGWANAIRRGTLAEPETGATLMLLVDSLAFGDAGAGAGDVQLSLDGPGIQATHRLQVGGLNGRWLALREGWNAEYPTGVDLILFAPDGTLAALPRSTQVKGV